jgi:coenzyme Q-binding protein COQ10
VLPYDAQTIYSVIADISSYSSFVPYCRRSTVTKWSPPSYSLDEYAGKRWPEEAELVVGWKDITEAFTSRVYCMPGKVVESVSGTARTTLDSRDLEVHSWAHRESAKTGVEGEGEQGTGGLLTHLISTWRIAPVAEAQEQGAKTDVRLTIEYAFSNPLYGALSESATPWIAEKMIEAFEDRVRKVTAEKTGATEQ